MEPCSSDFCRPVSSLCHNQLVLHVSSACIAAGPDCCTCVPGSFYDGHSCVPAFECPCTDGQVPCI